MRQMSHLRDGGGKYNVKKSDVAKFQSVTQPLQLRPNPIGESSLRWDIKGRIFPPLNALYERLLLVIRGTRQNGKALATRAITIALLRHMNIKAAGFPTEHAHYFILFIGILAWCQRLA